MTPSFEYKDVILEKALNSLKSVLSVTGKNKVLLSTEIVQAFEVTCPFQAWGGVEAISSYEWPGNMSTLPFNFSACVCGPWFNPFYC